MSGLPVLRPEALEQWLPRTLQNHYVDLLLRRIGMTRRRADCFVRLALYLFLKDCKSRKELPKPPMTELSFPQGWVECSCLEAADVFYSDRERGGDRAAGMMLNKLVDLGLIQKQFDGNCTQVKFHAMPDLLKSDAKHINISFAIDVFDPRSDAIPIANLLANNYNWLNRNNDAVTYRIANILRDWASQYTTGLRVLRRSDNQNPVGFYAFYPTKRESEVKFFEPPSRGLHLSQVADVDPFQMALAGDVNCRSLFVRSWVIDSDYRQAAQMELLLDAQKTMQKMQQDFPNLWDMYTLIIHPSYAELCLALGFQKTNADPKMPLYWMYQAVDRFLKLDMQNLIRNKQ
ncbi:MAG: hypothetical protein ACK5EU_10380 [Pseudanabaena sp.]|jgi:hypothetical protein|uniref:hypothetical protein n=1 Tax=Pseudanabaena mucicola TaxID=71190 RepID=UPI002577B772|nr:hypothetical protein [Pseudanabaena mucicola]MCA6588264.1 hypothetical protein [Pseudanabaena sp. M109S1SP1A06QC]MCA6596440.1 hypothetical protein [Pseudanabaena sp. M046S1SP1A06QC]MCA6611884.1 hypothetical protein [Pseudanabaena sp. M158S2SP1A06QC]MCA6613368.1 hypothetical protein [Pseudanabaena sp. M090S1SP1A06QC]MCA6621495.1 hypothetical protein [Pseudanabaena sp. M165S2SP1A06QC]MCE2975144.1 hypothetical protein [Pseudanabaena sp. CoA8_M7]